MLNCAQVSTVNIAVPFIYVALEQSVGQNPLHTYRSYSQATLCAHRGAQNHVAALSTYCAQLCSLSTVNIAVPIIYVALEQSVGQKPLHTYCGYSQATLCTQRGA